METTYWPAGVRQARVARAKNNKLLWERRFLVNDSKRQTNFACNGQACSSFFLSENIDL